MSVSVKCGAGRVRDKRLMERQCSKKHDTACFRPLCAVRETSPKGFKTER